MSLLDWVVFATTLIGVLIYGAWRGRNQTTTDDYLRAGRSMPWYMVLLGVMATQASAITFLSAPGQAFTDGMRFVQYYFGLPLAMIVISVTFIPIFRRQNVYTAYEYLEQRFDRKTRLAASVLFLVSRGLSTGVSIYAPSIVISSVTDLDIYLTNALVGGLLLVYTLRGGARSVAHTQSLMFGIILVAIVLAGIFLVADLPYNMSLSEAVTLADVAGRMNIITTDVDLHDKYNLWSGLIGGFFLALSYFGTDQSQVGRFITGRNIRESRLGLLMNGVVKIPMQLGILFIGVLLVLHSSSTGFLLSYNPAVHERVQHQAPSQAATLEDRAEQHRTMLNEATLRLLGDVTSAAARTEYRAAVDTAFALRTSYRKLAESVGVKESNDVNYIFLSYIPSMPIGLAGLLFAVIIMASWGSISAGFHSLATSSVVDVHDMIHPPKGADANPINRARWHSLFWAVFGILVSMVATQMGSLIEAVNILGSLFYGPILGIFLVAFYVRKANGTDVFRGAIVAELIVVAFWVLNVVSFLWLNVVGAVAVVLYALVSSTYHRKPTAQTSD